ncbi:hypothetical protein BG005_006333 [Podila minutissima]|nr:hypothetical protein BG005_006333 [Podila minutissima]
MFWKKDREEDSTMQLQEMAESPPLTGTDTAPSTLADIDTSAGRMPFKSHSSEKKPVSPRARPTIIDPCSLDPTQPHICHSKRLHSKFRNYSAGYYNVHWRVKATKDFNIPNGLHFAVNVKYNTEPDISGTLDVIMPPHRLNILVKNQWYNLMLEEKVYIQPHDGVAEVQVLLCNNENTRRDEYLGFVIEHVELRPITLRAESQAGVRNFIVQRAGIPNYSIDTMKSLPTTVDNSYLPPTVPVSRLVYTKASRYLATLSVSEDTAWIRVWDMSIVRNPLNPPRNFSKLYKTSATAIVHHSGIGKLPIGIAISPLGDQIAVFQEPRIGEWQEGNAVERAAFPFKLFNNPLVRQETLVVNIDSPASSNMDDTKKHSPDNSEQFYDRNGTYNSVNTPGTPSDGILLQEVNYTHDLLDSFIGFGEFVSESKKTEEEKKVETADAEDGVIDADDNGSTVKSPKAIKSCMFVACSGLYLDVYTVSPEKKWERSHTITLTDLLPTLSRRITCKMMMDSIGSDTFMWLEDNGRSCTIWDLMTGANISHISSIENARFKGPTFRGHSKMAISPHESIVALASVDGSLTTYFSRTGMAIDDRKFPGYKIEYVGFHGQDDQLCVILRNSVTFELTAKILDTLQLKSEFDINQVPIPTIGSTALAFFSVKGFWNRGIVCEADGTRVNCYISYQPQSGKVAKSSESVLIVEPTDVVYESLIDEQAQYRVVTAFHKELLPEGDGASYWVHRVELIEENLVARTQKLVFSFIPEPWMRAMTSDVVHPENLLSAYFMPCGTRFAVVGMQTLQIWNLPTHELSKCTLQFFWSQPREGSDLKPGGIAHKSRRVRDYYLETLNTTILVDTETDNTVAEIKMNDKQKKKVVPMPGPGTTGARLAIIHCFRSVHLLAAAYTFACREGKRVARLGLQQNFTFEDHAGAIVRFAHEHINRMMSIGVFSPRKKGPSPSSGPKEKKNKKLPEEDLRSAPPLYSRTGSSSIFDGVVLHANSNKRDEYDSVPKEFYEKNTHKDDGPGSNTNKSGVVTILTLLMDHAYLLDQNHEFVKGLLNTSNGDWIPREDIELNPIRRAIEARNGPLVEAFIEYCIKHAKKYHPAYLMPAVQCLTELSERYPAILGDMFRRASYVPAHNYSYIASHAIIANHQYRKTLKSYFAFWNYFKDVSPYTKSNNINDYAKPVLHLRSQLPFRSANFFHVLNIETSMRESRHEKFPLKPEISEEEERRRNRAGEFSHKIYVSPFPKLSMYGPYQGWQGLFGDPARSAFSDIAGQDYFDSPAMIAMLEFKWHKFGFYRWLRRFFLVLIFFILFVILTAKQTVIFSGEPKIVFTPNDAGSRYMSDWRPVFWTTIGFGCVLLLLELLQFRAGPGRYLRSPYNYFDLAAYTLPIIGCGMFLSTKLGTIDDVKGLGMYDVGPHQIWVMSFAVLALYLNILFELRVVRQLGVVVNIILNITRRTVWFLLIFGLFLLAFTHALLHLLHTGHGNVECIKNEGCKYEYSDGFPRTPFAALSAVYFFLAGRYDPVETPFIGDSTSFHLMMIIFFFFTAIMLLNILIALMNDAYNESKDEGQLAWLKQWSEVIAEIEIISMTPSDRQNCNYFPDYIYYGASEQEAELYESKYYIASKSNLSLENRFLIETVSTEHNATQLSQRAVLRDIQTVAHEMDKLRQTQDEFNQDMARLVELMAAYLAQTATTGDTGSEAASPIEQTTSPAEQQPTPISSPQDEEPTTPSSAKLSRPAGRRLPTARVKPSEGAIDVDARARPSQGDIGSDARMSASESVEVEDEEVVISDPYDDLTGGGGHGSAPSGAPDNAPGSDPYSIPGSAPYSAPIVSHPQGTAAPGPAPTAGPRPPMSAPVPPPLPPLKYSSAPKPPMPSAAPLPPPPMSSAGPVPRPSPASGGSAIPAPPPPPRQSSSSSLPELPSQTPSSRPLASSQKTMPTPAPLNPPPILQTGAAPSPFGKLPAHGRVFRPSTTPALLQHMLESKVAHAHVDSPTSYVPGVHFSSPATAPPSTSSMLSQLPGSVYYPEAGPSSGFPRYKIVDMPDQEAAMKAKTSQSSLKQRLQKKLMAVHTLDDALQGHHRLENTASNPTYVVPVRRSQSEYEDDDDDDEDEDEGSSKSSKNRKGARPVQMHHSRLARAHQPVRDEDDEYDDGGGAGEGPSSLASLVPEHEAPHRTQSEILLTGAEHEHVPLNVHPPRGGPPQTGDRP